MKYLIMLLLLAGCASKSVEKCQPGTKDAQYSCTDFGRD